MIEDAPTKQPGRRCDIGCESWPDSDEFDECPMCGQETTRYTNLYPIDMGEAVARKRELDFEDFYENDWPALREEWRAEHPDEAA